jgi:hypothetical protein
MKQLIAILEQSRTIKYDFPPLARLAKMFEEGGEFSETAMNHLGYLPHKTPKESPFGEADDVIITVLDTLGSLYPELSPERVGEILESQLLLKCGKWQRVVIDPRNASLGTGHMIDTAKRLGLKVKIVPV